MEGNAPRCAGGQRPLEQTEPDAGRRTLDLRIERVLKKEIARRQVVEEKPRQSEQHSSRLLDQSRRMQEELRVLSRGILSAQEKSEEDQPRAA